MFDADARAAADLAECRDIIRVGSRSFYAASLLLPKRVRDPAYALYAFCRASDDAVDLGHGGRGAVQRLQDRLRRAYAGRPDDTPVDRAFSRAVRDHDIPAALPAALLDGLDWDAKGRRYETIGALHAYAARVAGAVGAMMTVMMGARSQSAIARAADLGVAMQLTNIARDVGEDARAGRVYLPLAWLREAGLDEESFLLKPEFEPRLARLVERLLDDADVFYRRGLAGLAFLPRDCRAAIGAAAAIYAEIGEAVAANGYDSVSRRAVVSTRRKVAIAAAALGRRTWPADGLHAPPLAANGFLVDAAASAQDFNGAPPDPGAGWVIDLFIRLERRDRAMEASLAS